MKETGGLAKAGKDGRNKTAVETNESRPQAMQVVGKGSEELVRDKVGLLENSGIKDMPIEKGVKRKTKRDSRHIEQIRRRQQQKDRPE